MVPAEPARARVPVLVGEAQWARRVDARRIIAGLIMKAAALTPDPGGLRLTVCAREEISGQGPDTLCVTAAEIFAPG